jgi:hypothetical protein
MWLHQVEQQHDLLAARQVPAPALLVVRCSGSRTDDRPCTNDTLRPLQHVNVRAVYADAYRRIASRAEVALTLEQADKPMKVVR